MLIALTMQFTAPQAQARSRAIPPTAATHPTRIIPSTSIAPSQRPAGKCAFVGDSIAAGAATIMTECRAVTRKGLGSTAIARMTPMLTGDTVIVSAGVNDYLNPRLVGNLSEIRRRAAGARFIWIVPRQPMAASAVNAVASANGDREVRLSEMPSRDGVHPRNYMQLAARLRQAAR